MTDTDVDLEDVAAWVLTQTWLKCGYSEDDPAWQRRDFSPPLIRLYKQVRPGELKREAEKAAREAENERWKRETREANARWAAHKQMMRDMRKWGPENGYFVGTRGRIPRKVIEAYKEAKGIE
jgi:hypothetical protein